MEDPYRREFTQNPFAMVMEDRGKYIAAILTIMRAYHVANRPNRPPPFMSFDACRTGCAAR